MFGLSRALASRAAPALCVLSLLLSPGALRAKELQGLTRVPVTLIPGAEVVGQTTTVSFGLPLPPGVLYDPALVVVRDSQGQEIATHVRSLGKWVRIPPAALLSDGLPTPLPSPPSHRSVLLQFSYSFADDQPVTVMVELNGKRQLDVAEEVPVRSTWRLASEGTYVATDGIYEPRVYALLPPKWLAASGLTTLGTRSGVSARLRDFDQGQRDFFYSATNNLGLSRTHVVPYKKDPEPWLYDRAQTFYNGYLRTGQLDFLREAHRAAQQYMGLIYTAAEADSIVPKKPYRGFFKLSSPPGSFLDSKYCYNECLATLYWLTGDPAPLERLADVTAANKLKVPLDAVPNNVTTLSQWTERNFANSLLSTLSEYEVTGDPELESYLRKGVDTLWEIQNHPLDGSPPNGAFNNYVSEVGVKQGLSFSPWMSSLLAHALLRAYFTLGDERIPGMLVALAQAELDRALVKVSLRGQEALAPRYAVTGFGDVTVADRFTNDPVDMPEHAIDVAYVTALGAYFTNDPEQKAAMLEATEQLVQTHSLVLQNWTVLADPLDPSSRFPWLLPPRKYSWWYKNTGALAWVLEGPTPAPPIAPPPPPVMVGDLNGDSRIDISDVLVLLRVALRTQEPTELQKLAGDQNGDGVLGIADVLRLLQQILVR